MNIVQVYKRFSTPNSCINHLEKTRWKNKPVCPYCKSKNITKVIKERRHHCNKCNKTFSVMVGTIFHNTRLDLKKWFLAITLTLNAKKGISARQLARDLGVNKNTAWSMAMRIRTAMVDKGKLLKGIIEMDETYIGGKPRKLTRQKRKGRGTAKPCVVGMIERGGSVKASVTKVISAKKLNELVLRHVKLDESTVITDEFKGYLGLKNLVKHQTVNHSTVFTTGNIHTNTIEGFWALLKRGILGQYHKMTKPYLQYYLNEFAYRFNNRKNKDVFNRTLSLAVGCTV